MPTRARILSCLATGGAILVGFATALRSEVPSDSGLLVTPYALACGTSASVETELGATGEWRNMAPFPAPHEASPTLQTGVWVERWHTAKGVLEYRKVSAVETRVTRLDDAKCLPQKFTHRRSFNRDAMVGAFTDASLDSLMKRHDRGMIYVWSPRMPLSVKGLVEARAAARQLGISFKAVVAEANAQELHDLLSESNAVVTSSDVQPMESLELVYRNGTIHYPSTLFFAGARVIDGAYPGYKNRETFAMYGARQFAMNADSLLKIASSETENSNATPSFWVDKKARITTVGAVNTPRRIGFFFKPITGTSLVSYNARSVDYFFDFKTGKEIVVPGHIDPVPTPDGRFLTLPGLYFHRLPALVAGDVSPLFLDRALPDEYQTASILSETKTAVRYRVVTGWNAGARFRDYDVALDKKGVPTSVSPVDEPFVPCNERLLTLPINAKSGREFGAFDARAKTNIVLEVTDASHCSLKLDLGFSSGKISFSYDGAFIAFATSRINTESEGELLRPSELFHKDALALERKTGRIISLSQNAGIQGLTFPEFQKDGSVMLLDQYGPGRPVEQLRVVTFK